MRRAIAISAALAASSLALAGCGALSAGPTATEQPAIDEVNAVQLDTSGELVVTTGEPSLTVTAGERTMEHLTFETVDGVLVLGSDEPVSLAGDIHYELTLPSLDALAVTGSGHAEALLAGDEVSLSVEGSGQIVSESIEAQFAEVVLQGSGSISIDALTAPTVTIDAEGSGEVRADELDAETLATTIDGSGGIQVAGSAESQTVEVRGSAGFDGSALESVDARVELHGSGDLSVHATGSVDAVLDGSGTITCSGGGHLTQSTSGSGEIVEAD